MIDMRSGEFVLVEARAVLMATGGGPTMYRYHTPSGDKSCDGLAMALAVGLSLRDMEMVQFHPTGLVVRGSRLNGALLEEGLRGAGAQLFNGRGERYMERYDPERKERSTRDRVSRAGFMEIMAGRGTENGGVWIDVSHLGADFVEGNFEGMRDRCLRIGFDLARERVEVAPTAHFNMGGIRINRDGFTNLEGLFAAGEDASGVHGANRLGGNGVAESTVYGARVGDAVAKWVKNAAIAELPRQQIAEAEAEANQFRNRSEGDSPWALRDELGKVMWERVGIVRSGEKLKSALDEINSLRNRAEKMRAPGGRVFNLTWQQALDMRNMLLASELIARSALLREESRGAHYRQDFTKMDDTNWLKNIYLARNGIGLKSWTESVKLNRISP
jgi:Succinate dehydrogenase/fumarate reductase, flavoprotein subunit